MLKISYIIPKIQEKSLRSINNFFTEISFFCFIERVKRSI